MKAWIYQYHRKKADPEDGWVIGWIDSKGNRRSKSIGEKSLASAVCEAMKDSDTRHLLEAMWQGGEITVKVTKWGRANYYLRYTDPLTGCRHSQSAGTRDYAKAIRVAKQWERSLRERCTEHAYLAMTARCNAGANTLKMIADSLKAVSKTIVDEGSARPLGGAVSYWLAEKISLLEAAGRWAAVFVSKSRAPRSSSGDMAEQLRALEVALGDRLEKTSVTQITQDGKTYDVIDGTIQYF